MSHNLNIWIFIFIAAVISYFLRIFPLFFLKNKTLNKESPLFYFFEYASYSVVGGVIYLMIFGNQSIYAHLDKTILLQLAMLVLAFGLSIRIPSPVLTFLLVISLYGVFLYWV